MFASHWSRSATRLDPLPSPPTLIAPTCFLLHLLTFCHRWSRYLLAAVWLDGVRNLPTSLLSIRSRPPATATE